jgi:hypothetical protein
VRLLVSVRSPEEVSAALAGGAEIIDVKEPAKGALGAPRAGVVDAVAGRVPTGVPLSVALGDPSTVPEAVSATRRLVPRRHHGEIVLKLGFAGTSAEALAQERLAAVVAAARPAAVVAVAYADWSTAMSVAPLTLIGVAARSGAAGLLLDTFAKNGRHLFELMPVEAVRDWVEAVRGAGLLTAVAGSLTGASLAHLNQIGPDVVGVRGAACEGGRMGMVSEARVRELRGAIDRASRSPSATAKRQTIAPLTSR